MEGTTNFDQQPDFDRHETNRQIAGQSMAIPVIEEQVIIDKQVVESGVVRIRKNVHEEEVTVDVPLMHEEHHIERVPFNEYLDTPPPAVRYEGEKMIIPILREEVVVQKRIVLVEELHITKRQVETSEPQRVTLRKEEVTIDRSATNETNQNPDLKSNFNNSI